MSGRSAYDFFLRQGLFLIIGFVLFCLIIRFTTKAYGMMSHLLLVIFTAVLILLLIYGKATNYAVSWIRIGSFTIQPSEFIKIIMIIWMARYYEVHAKRLGSWFISSLPLMVGGRNYFFDCYSAGSWNCYYFCSSCRVYLFIRSYPQKSEKKYYSFCYTNHFGSGGCFVIIWEVFFAKQAIGTI